MQLVSVEFHGQKDERPTNKHKNELKNNGILTLILKIRQLKSTKTQSQITKIKSSLVAKKQIFLFQLSSTAIQIFSFSHIFTPNDAFPAIYITLKDKLLSAC